MWPRKKRAEASPLLPNDDPTSLGNLAITEGFLTPEEFAQLLSEFHDTRIEMLLGQFLVSRGKLSQEELDVLLLKQQRARNNGSVGHDAVLRIMDVARRTQDDLSAEVAQFNVAIKGEK